MDRATSFIVVAAIAGVALLGCNKPASSTAMPDTAAASAPAAASLERAEGSVKAAVGETVTTGKIKAAIASDAGMKDSDISVSTDKGVVTLSGTVKSQDQATIATHLAQRQQGVNRVESQLAVR